MEFCEPEAVMNAQENGWVPNDTLCDWFQHFKLKVLGGVNKDNKHLIMLDGYVSHHECYGIRSLHQNENRCHDYSNTLPITCSHLTFLVLSPSNTYRKKISIVKPT